MTHSQLKREPYTCKNVHVEVKKAISKYSKEKGIDQCIYLAKDKRIQKYLSPELLKEILA